VQSLPSDWRRRRGRANIPDNQRLSCQPLSSIAVCSRATHLSRHRNLGRLVSIRTRTSGPTGHTSEGGSNRRPELSGGTGCSAATRRSGGTVQPAV